MPQKKATKASKADKKKENNFLMGILGKPKGKS
jgi:hypothetical protein